MSEDMFWKLEKIAPRIEAVLPLGFKATAVANDGGKILIYMPTAIGRYQFAKLVPDESGKRLKVVITDSIETGLRTIAERIEL